MTRMNLWSRLSRLDTNGQKLSSLIGRLEQNKTAELMGETVEKRHMPRLLD